MNIQEALSSLGNSPEQVARTLLDNGITGRRYCCITCPVAVYLRKVGIGNPTVSVNIMWDTEFERHIRPTPEPVWEFMLRFDKREFPELLSEGAT